MASLVIRNATLVRPDRLAPDGAVRVERGRLVWVGPAVEAGRADTEIDARGQLLTPGLVDLQLNGAFGHDFTANPESVWAVAERLPRYGVTAFLPTIITGPEGVVRRAQTVLAKGAPEDIGTHAQPLGLHLEGPFLNPAKRGAHPPEHLRAPDLEWAADWLPETGVRLVTLAPELPGALELTRRLVERGVVVSMGHSAASYAEARAGLEAGITYGTHLYNAMAPFEHREPGVVGALLADERATVGVIADGVHVHPGAVRVAWRAKGPGGVTLVSDAMAGLGMGEGVFKLGDRAVTVRGGTARLEDGTLAGSVLSMDAAVRNLVEMTGCEVFKAVAAATGTPARALGGAGHDVGGLAVNGRADLVLLTLDLEVAATWVGGTLAYRSEKVSEHDFA
jgi:N-acetylglucosamine-6-phosphate deacetylase